ncbi:multicopper oxidase LPR1 homolog 1-like [Zingiber officinale]|uniref:Uncharacterized protein n=1 Tax=Zingiber officinale TaxID=94328 RepID=A0A8J5H0L6_ZINOF|nr:multicopper oxidase LPR1 homolog 1-like [Zingiber officinale]KAG6516532.1 hypothetical protein ZIOFF_026997 [Zingiber officinale]
MMAAKFLVAVLIVLMISGEEVAGSTGAPPPVSDAYLQRVARSLKKYVDPLPAMPKTYGYAVEDGRPKPIALTVGMYEKKWKFHRDLPVTTVFVYGTSRRAASYPGPAIEALQGVPLNVTWENHLPERHILPWDPTIPAAIPKHGGVPAVVHLHGGVNGPRSDGSAFAWFTSGFREAGPAWSEATYHYPNVQHPGNLWYHDHALGLTRANILAGLVGTYTIRNLPVETPFGLPSGRHFDRHLVISDRSFYEDGSLYMNYTGNVPSVHPEWQPEYFGEVIVVNGKAWPYLAVLRRKYRFRILNSSNARYFNLSLSDGLPFTVIGSDVTYHNKPVTAPSILIAPAEIYDVVIDFAKSETSAVRLTNSAPYPFPGGDPPNMHSSKIMKFVISPKKTADDSRIPAKLVDYPVANVKDAIKKRYIVLYEYQMASGEPTHLYINGKRLEDPATETPRPGSTEVWQVINLTEDNHPLHLHLATFQAARVRGLVALEAFKACMREKNDAVKCDVKKHATGPVTAVPEHERTWKNIVKIAPGSMTTIVVQFKLIDRDEPYPFDATGEPGYVYHCHILDHEDNVMIRPLILKY